MFKLFLVSLMLIRAANLSDVTYYEILEISKTASSQEIRHAYKKLAVKYHPDKNSNEKEQEKFIKITEAYEMLKDPEKRRKYDLYGTFSSYTRKYDYRSQAEYNNLYYNGLYYNDPYVDTVTGAGFYNYLTEGFHFINFYSPFCPPCQNLADHWKKLAELYKGIMKVGAVNCKYHNSFCYNSMRIGSYPSLLFYPNAKHGNFIYYHGEQNLEALDAFVMKYLRSQVHVPTVAQLRSDEKPMAYVLGSNRIDKNILTRISYHLKDLVTVVIVEDDDLRAKLTDDEYTTVVFKYKDIKKEISSTEEKNILKEIVEALPKIEAVTPEKLKDIRNQLRNGYDKPWVLYFSTPGQNKLLLHQMTISYPHMHFGEVDCSKWSQLCLSLQVEEYPAWALLKRGGGYQLAPNFVDIRSFLNTATAAVNLHSLSASELSRIVGGDVGVWVLVVIPYQLSWDHVYEPFLQASLHFIDSQDISFGIASCSSSSDEYCKRIVSSQPAVLLQDRSRRHYYRDRIDQHRLIEFIELIKNSNDLELTEQQLLEIMDPSNREESWLVSFLPSNCGPHCDGLMHELRLVAKKLRPLQFVRTGVLRCAAGAVGLCRNVRAPTARLYPLASGQHYTVSLQHLTEAPYILEWALEHIDDSVQKLNWHSFSKNVIAEDLNPTSGKKPWLVYFHSPRCYRCYEMYADFAIAGILLNNAVNLGKVNCITERSLCQHEQITSYPSLRLYLNRNNQQTFSSVISIPVKDYSTLLLFIKPHLTRYDEGLLAGVDFEVKSQGFGVKHDEL